MPRIHRMVEARLEVCWNIGGVIVRKSWKRRSFDSLRSLLMNGPVEVRGIPPLPQKQRRGKDGAPSFCGVSERQSGSRHGGRPVAERGIHNCGDTQSCLVLEGAGNDLDADWQTLR